MKTFALIISALITNGWLATGALAQTGKELDITLSVVDEADSPATIINRIELPPASAVAPLPAINEPTPDINPAPNALDQLQDDLQNTTGNLLNTTGDVLTNTINDALSGGDATQLPAEIIDNLPEDLPDDLLPVPLPDALLQAPVDAVDNVKDVAPAVENTLDSVMDDLEQQTQPSAIEQNLDSVIPDDSLIEQLPAPLDDNKLPVNP